MQAASCRDTTVDYKWKQEDRWGSRLPERCLATTEASLRSGGGWRDVQPTAGNTEHVVPLVADVITGRSDCAEINLQPGDKVSKLYNQ